MIAPSVPPRASLASVTQEIAKVLILKCHVFYFSFLKFRIFTWEFSKILNSVTVFFQVKRFRGAGGPDSLWAELR